MTIRGYWLLYREWQYEQERQDRRFFTAIDYITASMGRSADVKLDPGAMFPSLRRMKYLESDEDVDPVEAFEQTKMAFGMFGR